jgi:hypothetical protein
MGYLVLTYLQILLILKQVKGLVGLVIFDQKVLPWMKMFQLSMANG